MLTDPFFGLIVLQGFIALCTLGIFAVVIAWAFSNSLRGNESKDADSESEWGATRPSSFDSGQFLRSAKGIPHTPSTPQTTPPRSGEESENPLCVSGRNPHSLNNLRR